MDAALAEAWWVGVVAIRTRVLYDTEKSRLR